MPVFLYKNGGMPDNIPRYKFMTSYELISYLYYNTFFIICQYLVNYSFTSVVGSSVTVSTFSSTTGASVSTAGASSGATAASSFAGSS